MRASSVRKHIQPLVLGIFLGLVVGLCVAIPELKRNGYAAHRMYYSTACLLRHFINPCVFMACLLLYALHMGRTVKGWLSLLPLLLSAVPCLIIADKVFGLRHWLGYVFRDVDPVYVRSFFAAGFSQILAACAVIVLGIVLIVRMRRKITGEIRPEEVTEKVSTPDITTPGTVMSFKGVGPLTAIIVLLFVVVNMLPPALYVKNGLDLRTEPNIVFIMVDTLRADHLGCYGYSRNTSPNIDRLASQSLRFEKAISQAPWTTASISSFMSSRYLRIALDPRNPPVPSNVVLMPELLRDRGYVTGAVITNPMAGVRARLDRGYDFYYEMPEGNTETIAGKKVMPGTALDESLKMIRQMDKKRFFLFTLFMGPHSPYAAHKA
ncbi:MAG TPA: sulfatase-like hydrolase/transferase, partial [Armatimonadota bacterium]